MLSIKIFTRLKGLTWYKFFKSCSIGLIFMKFKSDKVQVLSIKSSMKYILQIVRVLVNIIKIEENSRKNLVQIISKNC